LPVRQLWATRQPALVPAQEQPREALAQEQGSPREVLAQEQAA